MGDSLLIPSSSSSSLRKCGNSSHPFEKKQLQSLSTFLKLEGGNQENWKTLSHSQIAPTDSHLFHTTPKKACEFLRLIVQSAVNAAIHAPPVSTTHPQREREREDSNKLTTAKSRTAKIFPLPDSTQAKIFITGPPNRIHP
jgi:hypothetical protein